ncbi:MAG: hypothetical protein ABSE17_00415 [Candidatus Levyibacteriota bacterium]|jgi:hypothetical protein
MVTKVELIGSFQKPEKLGKVLPGKQTSPFPNYSPQGKEEFIVFGCKEDNSGTFILWLTPDTESELSDVLPEALEMGVFNIKERRFLQLGQSHILELKETKDGPTTLVRLTHE